MHSQYTMEQVARQTCEHVRKIIKTGFTSLQSLPHASRYQVDVGILGLRCMNIDDDYRAVSLSPCLLTQHRDFEIAKIEKFSIGNCGEHTYLGIDYIWHQYPGVYAEVFYIKEGDHAFIVINRNKHSNIADPRTWGDNAWVCDPWDNKYFLAAECETALYSYTPVIHTLAVEKICLRNGDSRALPSFFQREKSYKLTPVASQPSNTDTLSYNRHDIITIFSKKSNTIRTVLRDAHLSSAACEAVRHSVATIETLLNVEEALTKQTTLKDLKTDLESVLYEGSVQMRSAIPFLAASISNTSLGVL